MGFRGEEQPPFLLASPLCFRFRCGRVSCRSTFRMARYVVAVASSSAAVGCGWDCLSWVGGQLSIWLARKAASTGPLAVYRLSVAIPLLEPECAARVRHRVGLRRAAIPQVRGAGPATTADARWSDSDAALAVQAGSPGACGQRAGTI